jgi:hypothetical protein
VSGQLHAPAPGTHWIGGRVDPRARLADVENILDPTGIRTPTPLGRPARSQSLYRLRLEFLFRSRRYSILRCVLKICEH